MVFIPLDQGELRLLRKAHEKKDWRMLTSWKLRFAYQFDCDKVQLQEIAREARKRTQFEDEVFNALIHSR